MSHEKCQICGVDGPDLRTLKLSYFYQLDEISDKFQLDADGNFQITTCKQCRGDFLHLTGKWTSGELAALREKHQSDPDRTIPVRVQGRTVMMTPEEYSEHQSG